MNAENHLGLTPNRNSQGLFCVQLLVVALISLVALFVGGPVFSLLVISSLLIAQTVSVQFGTALGICIGMIYSLLFTLVEFMVLIPVLRFFSFSRSLFFDEAWIEPFVARATTLEHLVELNRFGAIVIAAAPVAMAALLCFRAKHHRSVLLNPAIVTLSFLPLLIAGFKKFQDPLAYVVSTASGDGRNFFLHVQRIRVTSGFTSFQNFSSQGDFGTSLSSLVSDGFGSKGLFRFGDQYSVAALYSFFGVLIAASAIAAVVTLADTKFERPTFVRTEWFYAIFLLASIACIQMPWVMNEMFRSGFFSAVVAMSFSAAMVAVCIAQVPFIYKACLLTSITILVFVVYPMAAIYPLFALILLALPTIGRRLRTTPLPASVVLFAVVLIAVFATPRVTDQLRSRLLLEGAITFLDDSIWLPLAIAGSAIGLARGKLRLFGLVIFVSGAGTAGFQILAQQLREDDGLFGYGYYGVKCGYLGLFIFLFALITGVFALVLLGLRSTQTSGKNLAQHRVFHLLSAAGLVLLASTTSGFMFPESRGFFGNSDSWTQPTSQGLGLAVKYWDQPKVLFVKISDPGNDKLINFWHPYFWSGDPWNWVYSGYADDPGSICAFIDGKDILVVTSDAAYGETLTYTCGAEVESQQAMGLFSRDFNP